PAGNSSRDSGVGRRARRRASFVLGGVRLQQAAQAQRQSHRDEVGEPPCLDLHRRGRQERQGREMGVGNGRCQRALSSRLAEDLVAGTMLVIDGYQARNGSKTANATSITFENGKRLFAASSSQGGAS